MSDDTESLLKSLEDELAVALDFHDVMVHHAGVGRRVVELEARRRTREAITRSQDLVTRLRKELGS